jgi:hypothetical protein
MGIHFCDRESQAFWNFVTYRTNRYQHVYCVVYSSSLDNESYSTHTQCFRKIKHGRMRYFYNYYTISVTVKTIRNMILQSYFNKTDDTFYNSYFTSTSEISVFPQKVNLFSGMSCINEKQRLLKFKSTDISQDLKSN